MVAKLGRPNAGDACILSAWQAGHSSIFILLLGADEEQTVQPFFYISLSYD